MILVISPGQGVEGNEKEEEKTASGFKLQIQVKEMGFLYRKVQFKFLNIFNLNIFNHLIYLI